jgi:hypothetical protein
MRWRLSTGHVRRRANSAKKLTATVSRIAGCEPAPSPSASERRWPAARAWPTPTAPRTRRPRRMAIRRARRQISIAAAHKLRTPAPLMVPQRSLGVDRQAAQRVPRARRIPTPRTSRRHRTPRRPRSVIRRPRPPRRRRGPKSTRQHQRHRRRPRLTRARPTTCQRQRTSHPLPRPRRRLRLRVRRETRSHPSPPLRPKLQRRSHRRRASPTSRSGKHARSPPQ